jgi:tryptophan synthase beta chain
MSGEDSPDLVPTRWCNFLADHPQYATRDIAPPPAVRDGRRRVSIVPQQPLALARQSRNTTDPWVPIPEALVEHYRRYRPTPLLRARSLEQRLGGNARIYLKYEGANITGSHKLNTALAQAYYYHRSGVEHLVTGTGAGQWGTALAYACHLLGIRCTVFMVGASLRQKPQRPAMMTLFGATVHESPTLITAVGRAARTWDADRVGTLAVATGEALEFAKSQAKTRFAVGSGENCVLLHQTLIGIEAAAQLDRLGDFPDVVVGAMGAGSNLAGVSLPLLREARARGRRLSIVAVESTACPRLTRGKYAFDYNDFSGTTPISRMYTLGSGFIPPAIYAGGLRYHGCSPFLSAMYADGGFTARAVDQQTVLGAGLLLAETECLLPAPESAHAVAGALDLVRDHPESAPPLVLVINISGHGLLDLTAYEAYAQGRLGRADPDEEKLAASLSEVDTLNRAIEDVQRQALLVRTGEGGR